MAVVGECQGNAAAASVKSQYGEAVLQRASPFWRSLWAGIAAGVLKPHRLQHAVGVQLQGTATKRRFEDPEHVLALALFTGASHAARKSCDCAKSAGSSAKGKNSIMAS